MVGSTSGTPKPPDLGYTLAFFLGARHDCPCELVRLRPRLPLKASPFGSSIFSSLKTSESCHIPTVSALPIAATALDTWGLLALLLWNLASHAQLCTPAIFLPVRPGAFPVSRDWKSPATGNQNPPCVGGAGYGLCRCRHGMQEDLRHPTPSE